MTYQCFNVEIQDHIAHIQLCRPNEMNTMTQAFWRELPQVIQAIDDAAQARVIVISAQGKHFSAGMDLSVFSDPKTVQLSGDPGRVGENLRRFVAQLQDSLSSLEQCRIPVLTAIHGACIGGATAMVCGADSRYCTEDAYFTIKETELGLTADVGVLQRLPKLIPAGMVRELAYTGRKFGAQEAKELGFVNQVYPSHEAMLDGVMTIAQQIAANSPLAVVGCKEMLNYARDHSVQDSLNYMATWQAGMFRPNDMMKIFAAKAQKTQPEFENVWPQKPLFEEK